MFKISRKIRIWLGWLAVLITVTTTYIFLFDGKPKLAFLILVIGSILGGLVWFSADYLPYSFSWINKKIKIGEKRTL